MNEIGFGGHRRNGAEAIRLSVYSTKHTVPTLQPRCKGGLKGALETVRRGSLEPPKCHTSRHLVPEDLKQEVAVGVAQGDVMIAPGAKGGGRRRSEVGLGGGCTVS